MEEARVKLWPYLVLIALVVVCGYGWHTSHDALVRYKAEQAQALADAIKVQKEKDDAILAHNEKVISDLLVDTRDAGDRADSLAARLSAALARRCPVPEAPGQPTATPPSGESSSPQGAGVLAALAGYDAACQRDAARLNALNDELTLQLQRTP